VDRKNDLSEGGYKERPTIIKNPVEVSGGKTGVPRLYVKASVVGF